MNFLKQAYLCSQQSSDVPIGAVLVYQNNIVAQAYNKSKINPFEHAEALVIAEAYRMNLDLSTPFRRIESESIPIR